MTPVRGLPPAPPTFFFKRQGRMMPSAAFLKSPDDRRMCPFLRYCSFFYSLLATAFQLANSLRSSVSFSLIPYFQVFSRLSLQCDEWFSCMSSRFVFTIFCTLLVPSPFLPFPFRFWSPFVCLFIFPWPALLSGTHLAPDDFFFLVTPLCVPHIGLVWIQRLHAACARKLPIPRSPIFFPPGPVLIEVSFLNRCGARSCTLAPMMNDVFVFSRTNVVDDESSSKFWRPS